MPHRLDRIARDYVQLVLAVGVRDADYVDAYYGPPEWRAAAEAERAPLATIGARAAALRDAIDAVEPDDADDAMRHDALRAQVAALGAHVAMLDGARLAFDDESRALYDAVAPRNEEAHLAAALDRLDAALPGTGDVAARLEAFRRGFAIPRDRVERAFVAAMAECRARTRRHLPLPDDEGVTVEYVTGRPWSGYNWYAGGFRSVVQLNVDLAIHADRPVDLAAHEGYPGHHAHNVVIERELVRRRGWIEFAVYPLFSPQSLLAEGIANHAAAVAFPGDERAAFERETIFPLAGLDPARVEEWHGVLALVRALAPAGVEGARRHLDGALDAAGAVAWLRRYALMPLAAAEQRVRFVDRYRSYVVTYVLGEALVGAHVERAAGGDATRRWAALGALLAAPRPPSALR